MTAKLWSILVDGEEVLVMAKSLELAMELVAVANEDAEEIVANGCLSDAWLYGEHAIH